MIIRRRETGSNSLSTPVVNAAKASESAKVAKDAVDTSSSVDDLENLNSKNADTGKGGLINSETHGTEHRKVTKLESYLACLLNGLVLMYIPGIFKGSDKKIVAGEYALNALSYYLTYRYLKKGKWGYLAIVYAASVAGGNFFMYFAGGTPSFDDTWRLIKGE